jgi:hypothetical protein
MVGWAGHVASRGGGLDTGFLSESQKGRGHQEDLNAGGRIILKYIL